MVNACARVYYSVFSQIHIYAFVMNFFLFFEVHCACIHYHSHTYIRHKDIASLLPRHTSVNTEKHAEGLHFSAFIYSGDTIPYIRMVCTQPRWQKRIHTCINLCRVTPLLQVHMDTVHMSDLSSICAPWPNPM